MDASRFDRWNRSLSAPRNRRQALTASVAVVFGLGAAHQTDAAKKCTAVGNGCGNAGDCCSGVCKGKKGKKTCRAHDTGGCTKGQNSCQGMDDIPCTTSAGDSGGCYTTTGNAGYCAADGECTRCTADKDCRRFFGPTAACIKNCNFCASTGGFACVGTRGGGPMPVRRSFGRG